jgi:3-phytase
MYVSPASGKYYYFANAKSGVCQQYELSDGGGGNVSGTLVRSFDVGGQTEGCVADDVRAQFYIGEEAVGVWKYGAEPGDGSTRNSVDNTSGNLRADVEGVGLYYVSNGGGYLIVSSQGNSTFSVYERTGNNAYLGTFTVVANGAIDAVSGTDGLDVTNLPLGASFPQGLLVVHDSSNSGGSASNHKYVPWQHVASALNLSIDTSWDPRQVRGGAPVADTTPPAAITDLAIAGSGSINTR